MSFTGQIYMLLAVREVRIGKDCARGLEYSRPRAQFFPIRTNQGRQITCLFFSFYCFKSNFCVEFFIKDIQLKSGVRARIHEKSKMSFFADSRYRNS